MDFAGAELIHFSFLGGAVNGGLDNCLVRSVSWVDGLEIKNSSTTSTTKIENVAIDIFPNPSFGKYQFKEIGENIIHIKVYDLLGEELEKGKLKSGELNLKYKGMLFLVLKSNNGNQSIFKVINQ